MQPFEILGHWWTPESESKKVPGILKFTYEEGITLKLIGSFKSPYLGCFSTHSRFSIILGEDEKHKKITLVNCVSLNPIICQIGYRGAHFKNLEDIVFNEAAVGFSYLQEWIQITGFNGTFGENFQVNYNEPNEIVAQTKKGKISIKHGISYSTDLWRKYLLEQVVDIKIKPSSDVSFDDLSKDFIMPLGNLVSLGTDTRNCLTSLYVFNNDVFLETRDGNRPEPIEVFFITERPSGEIQTPQVLFTIHDIAKNIDELSEVINNWLEFADKAEVVFELFFSTLNNTTVNTKRDFIKLAQAAEAYHRTMINNEVIPEKEFKARKKLVLDATPAELKDWAKEQLAYGNEPKYKVRLQELYDITKNIIGPLVANFKVTEELLINLKNENVPDSALEKLRKLITRSVILQQDITDALEGLEDEQVTKYKELIIKHTLCNEDRDVFLTKLVHTRNYYTHHAEKGKAATTLEELWKLYNVLLFMLRACFLKELGVPEEKRKELIEKSGKYIFALQEVEQRKIENTN